MSDDSALSQADELPIHESRLFTHLITWVHEETIPTAFYDALIGFIVDKISGYLGVNLSEISTPGHYRQFFREGRVDFILHIRLEIKEFPIDRETERKLYNLIIVDVKNYMQSLGHTLEYMLFLSVVKM